MELDLRNLLSSKELSRKEKILAILISGEAPEKQVKDIREIGIQNGLPEISKWNVSQILSQLKGLVLRLPNGWAVTEEGKNVLRNLGIVKEAPTAVIQPTLRKYVNAISSAQTKEFLEEAITALEFKLYRSAVVLSWIGAVSILYEEVLLNHLSAFNAEAKKRFGKWKNARTTDDLTRMREYDFLQILAAISVIGKNTKDELEQCLKLRNTCGHPNSYNIGEHRVASHLETLILNVYAKFVV